MTLNHCMPDCHLQAEETLGVIKSTSNAFGDPQLILVFYVPEYLSHLPCSTERFHFLPKAVCDVREQEVFGNVECIPVFSGITMGLSLIPGAATDWLCDQSHLTSLGLSFFICKMRVWAR